MLTFQNSISFSIFCLYITFFTCYTKLFFIFAFCLPGLSLLNLLQLFVHGHLIFLHLMVPVCYLLLRLTPKIHIYFLQNVLLLLWYNFIFVACNTYRYALKIFFLFYFSDYVVYSIPEYERFNCQS